LRPLLQGHVDHTHHLEDLMKHTTLRMSALAIALAAAGCATTNSTERSAAVQEATPGIARTSAAPGAEVPLVGPPGARPGECYARVFNPARYETQAEQVVKTAASERIEIIPAQTEEVEEQVMIKPATTRIEVVPPVYETVQEQVLVEPERVVLEQVPAEYETVSERVLVKPALQVWRKASEGASSNITKVDAATGEVLCLVEIPAEYETVTKQVVKTAATTRERIVPAVYKTVERQVLKTPAITREVEVPAEYSPVKVTRVVEPAREQRVEIPAQYETVQRTVLAEPAKEEWRQVLCEANASPGDVRNLQDALRSAGYDPGPSSGELNAQTMQALREYQAARNLPVDRGEYVNMKTAQALGVASDSATAGGDAPAAAGSGASAAKPAGMPDTSSDAAGAGMSDSPDGTPDTQQ
jgi:hypothetical protein